MEKVYTNLKDFYPYYLTEHQNLTSRRLHFVGTSFFLAVFAYAIFTTNWTLLWACPVLGYGFAWAGHYFFERNKPATFKYPAMSLISDFIMFWHILTGQLPAKMANARRLILNEA
jgi:hypothetical protein